MKRFGTRPNIMLNTAEWFYIHDNAHGKKTSLRKSTGTEIQCLSDFRRYSVHWEIFHGTRNKKLKDFASVKWIKISLRHVSHTKTLWEDMQFLTLLLFQRAPTLITVNGNDAEN